jgi:hypothetical protein
VDLLGFAQRPQDVFRADRRKAPPVSRVVQSLSYDPRSWSATAGVFRRWNAACRQCARPPFCIRRNLGRNDTNGDRVSPAHSCFSATGHFLSLELPLEFGAKNAGVCVRQRIDGAHRLARMTAACRILGIRSGHAAGAVDRVAVEKVFEPAAEPMDPPPVPALDPPLPPPPPPPPP